MSETNVIRIAVIQVSGDVHQHPKIPHKGVLAPARLDKNIFAGRRVDWYRRSPSGIWCLTCVIDVLASWLRHHIGLDLCSFSTKM